MPFLIVVVPLQFVIVAAEPAWLERRSPRCFHLFGVRLPRHEGQGASASPRTGRPTLIVSNHISWTDIIAIGSIADVTFVAKTEVREMVLRRLHGLAAAHPLRRPQRAAPMRTAASREMGKRMASGGAVLLFAEGQSDVGTHVLPFRSALVGAAQHAMRRRAPTRC